MKEESVTHNCTSSHDSQCFAYSIDSRQMLTRLNRIVIKVGTTSLTYPNGKLNLNRINELSWVLTDLRNSGKKVILVSSGAIAVGADRLGLAERPRDIKGKQAASAVGQAVLMQIYENFFMNYNQKVAQLLLTKDVIEDEARKQNARNTIETLLDLGVIPIVNENDTISVEELGFSDNDSLSACVACLVQSQALIILSDINGLYNQNPRTNPNARLLSMVTEINSEIEAMGGDADSSLGTGGMATKISAAKMATRNNIHTVIASGESPEIINAILKGENIGTFFVAQRVGQKPVAP